MSQVLEALEHRPYALPAGRWSMSQRWNDLLFAHWPIEAGQLAGRLPAGLEVDTFDGYAWVGVVPFHMDRVRSRLMGSRAFGIPGTLGFPELNLRTYVRSRETGLAGVYFFSLDAASALAVIGARVLFHLPYFWARMKVEHASDGTIGYRSERLLAGAKAHVEVRYRGLGRPADARCSEAGSIEHFLTERYCLFTAFGGRLVVGHIHHLPWPLEAAEAEFAVNRLPEAHGIVLPDRPPLLHFAKELEVYIWSLTDDRAAGSV